MSGTVPSQPKFEGHQRVVLALLLVMTFAARSWNWLPSNTVPLDPLNRSVVKSSVQSENLTPRLLLRVIFPPPTSEHAENVYPLVISSTRMLSVMQWFTVMPWAMPCLSFVKVTPPSPRIQMPIPASVMMPGPRLELPHATVISANPV